MIEIESIEIVNIRSIGDATIQPLMGGGMTALTGPNGAGKSSIVSAIMWALYGVTPDGVPVKALRRQGSEGPCKGVVTATVNGQRIRVERGLKGAKDNTYLHVTLDGVEQAFGKIGEGDAFIRSLLGGLDSEAFLTAFVIRQKELDDLVKKTRAERRQLIERLAGIERMNAAVHAAREEQKDVKKRLDALPGSKEEVDAARAALEAAQQTAAEAWETFESLRDQAAADEQAFAEAKVTLEALQADLDTHGRALDAARTAQHQASLAAERADQAERELARLRTEAQGGSQDDVAAARAAARAAQEAAQANREARDSAERAQRDAAREAQRAAQATDRANRLRAAADQARRLADEAASRAASFPADLDEQVAAAQRAADILTDRMGALRGEYERLTASIKALSATAEPKCPTCATGLADPNALVETLTQARARVGAEGTNAKVEREQAAEKADRLRRQAADAAKVQQEARHYAEQAQRAATEASQSEAEAASASAEAASAQRFAAEAATAAKAALAEADLIATEVEYTAAALRKAENAADASAKLPQAQQAAQAARTAAAAAAAEADAAAAAEQAARVSDADRRSVQDAFAHAQTAAQESVRAATVADADFRVAQEKVNSAERDRDVEEAKLRARVETMAELEAKTAVTEALDQFRKDRLARLAPELSEVATDYVARIFEGKYVSVELDEEFTAIVTDANGNRRPVALLSGGEESAVALALRMAIRELLTGQRGGLLVLDEPHTAMDAQRRQSFMAALRTMPGEQQVIIISHVAEATDMVDLVLVVVPDDAHGSTVTPETPYNQGDVSRLDLDEPALA